MNVLVTGGLGFIGSHLVERLQKEDIPTVIIDNHSHASQVKFKRPIPTHKLDVADKQCELIFSERRFDVLFHLAGETLPLIPSVDECRLLDSSVAGLSNMLSLAKQYQVGKVIVLSSYQVYGLQAFRPILETDVTKPADLTGQLMQLQETCCAAYRSVGLNVVVLRLSEVYGPRQGRTGSFIQKMVEEWLNDQPLTPSEAPHERKDYIYIGDVIEAMIQAAENATDPVLNISSGSGVSNQTVFETCSYAFMQKACQRQKRVFDRLHDVRAHEGDDSEDCPEDLPAQIPPGLSDQTEPACFEPDVSEIPAMILDNRRALFQLDWQPRYLLADGVRKLVSWSDLNSRQGVQAAPAPATARPVWKSWFSRFHSAHPEIDTLILFAFMFVASYVLKTKLGLDLDLLIIYVIVINLFYGLKQGGLAIALAIAARMLFLFRVDGVRMIDLMQNINLIISLTLYFIVGVSIGYVIDLLNHDKSQLTIKLDEANRELDIVNRLYEKSIDITRSLQEMMAYHDDSLIKALNIVSRLEKVETSLLFQESVTIMAEALKIDAVHLYRLNQTHDWLRQAAVHGRERYPKSIRVSRHPSLAQVIDQHAVSINKSLDLSTPLVSVPVVIDGNTYAVIFLDDIDFKRLSQNFMNIVKTMAQTLSVVYKRRLEYHELLRPLQYHPKTIILKQEWFARIIKALCSESAAGTDQVILLKVDNHVPRYDAFTKKAAGLIRTTDYLGELESGRLGIILTQTAERDVPAVIQRFAQIGYKLVIMKRGEGAA